MNNLDHAMGYAHAGVHYLIKAADEFKNISNELAGLIKKLNEIVDRIDELNEELKKKEKKAQ